MPVARIGRSLQTPPIVCSFNQVHYSEYHKRNAEGNDQKSHYLLQKSSECLVIDRK